MNILETTSQEKIQGQMQDNLESLKGLIQKETGIYFEYASIYVDKKRNFGFTISLAGPVYPQIGVLEKFIDKDTLSISMNYRDAEIQDDRIVIPFYTVLNYKLKERGSNGFGCPWIIFTEGIGFRTLKEQES